MGGNYRKISYLLLIFFNHHIIEHGFYRKSIVTNAQELLFYCVFISNWSRMPQGPYAFCVFKVNMYKK